MKTDQRLPKEVAAWALSFMYSYLAIWDAPKDEEFVLSDQGIVSEYEGFHMITGGIDCSKISYLFSKAKSNEQLAPYFLLKPNIQNSKRKNCRSIQSFQS